MTASRQVKYESYTQYLRAISKPWPDYWKLLNHLTNKRWASNPWSPTGLWMIADFTDKLAEIKVFREDDRNVEPSMFEAALSSYREDTKTRVIVVSNGFRSEPIEALGMAFDIDIALLDLGLNRMSFKSGPSNFESLGQFVTLEPFLYAQILKTEKHATAEVNVVLVITSHEIWDRPNHGILSFGRPSIYKPVPDLPIAVNYPRSPGSWRYLLDRQSRIVEDILQNLNGGDCIEANKQPLEYLCPFIHLAAQTIFSDISVLRENFRQRSENHAESMTEMAASQIEIINYTESLNNLIHTLKGHCQVDAGELSATLSDVIGFCERVLNDGLHLCNLVQEWLHIINGLTSIRESRKSIEEAASVKRLTRLAFVFIPLSYTSSLFGMNIKEINGGIPGLWIFIIVSVSISLVTLLVSSFVKWVMSHSRRFIRSYVYDVFYVRQRRYKWLLTIGRGPLISVFKKIPENWGISNHDVI